MKPTSIVLFFAFLCLLAISCGSDPEQTQIVVQPEAECEADEDCGAVGQGCVRGFCACVDAGCACRRDTDCGGALLCDVDDGACFEPECLGDGSCPNEGEICLSGRCEASLVDDADRDGVPDAEDNCPRVDNADQDNLDGDDDGDACDDDDDGDGTDDSEDNCPRTPNDTQEDQDGDGVGDACEGDLDTDGVPDDDDNCPAQANADQNDLDGDGEGDACDNDDDNDTVPDTTDNCPTVANRPSGTDNTQGDANNDGLGNVCDPVVRGTTVVGRLDLSAGGGPDPTAARISLTGEGVYNPAPVAVIDETGGFVFDQALFASGFFTVRVERAGFVVFRKDFVSTNTPEFDTGTISLVPESDDVQTAVILRGRTLLQDSQRHSGILVELQIGEETVASTVTNPEGEFVLTASRVDHRLRFSKEGFITDEQNVVWNTEAVQFELGGVPIEEADPPVLAPLLDADLEGQISTPIEGFPVRDAVVTLTGDVAQRLGVDDDGGFGIENQAPGLYRLDVSLDGHRDESFIIDLASGLNTLGPIPLEAIERSLEGRVVTRIEVEGEDVEVPLENVAVRLRLDGQLAVPPSLSDEQGRFLFDVLPLSYTLSLSAANFLPRTIEVEFDGEDFIVDGEPLGLDSPLELVRAPESDRDRDGVIDLLDNCPEAFDPNLSDIDGDGLGDVCDDDADGDGMINGLDNCPFSFNPMQEDPEGLGRGIACVGGTLAVPFSVGFGVVGQHLDTRARPSTLQGSCGGGGSPEVVYRLPIKLDEAVSVTVASEHAIALYVLDERDREVACFAARTLNIPEDIDLEEGVYKLVVDGFALREASGPITVDISLERRAPFAQDGDPLPTGDRPLSVKLGDLDGDNHLDLITANTASGDVRVRLGDGIGGFGPEDITPVANATQDIALGDMDEDGLVDIVAASSEGVTVLRNDGDGGFEKLQSFRSRSAVEIEVGYINDDDHLDAVASSLFDDDVGVFLGDGNGGFTPLQPRLRVGEGPKGLALGDLNGDGFLDIATANYNTDDATVMLGDGQGGFEQPARGYPMSGGPSALLMADVSADGHVDLVLVNEDHNTVGVLLGDGLGDFGLEETFSLNAGVTVFPFGMALGDLDGDGDLDTVTTNYGNDTVTVLAGDGLGGFTFQETHQNIGDNPSSAAIGDLDGDGRPEIVFVSELSGEVRVLKSPTDSTLAPPIIITEAENAGKRVMGDLNNDGHLDIASPNPRDNDVRIILSDGNGNFEVAHVLPGGGGANSAAIGDLNNDGFLDVVHANGGIDDTVGVHLSDGQGGFGALTTHDAGDNPAT